MPFVLRNISYSIKNIRKLPRIRRAMRMYKKNYTACAYCGRSKSVHIHHVVPVKVAPELAGELSNFMILCGKRCHLTIGHMGNWRTYNKFSRLTCHSAGQGQ